MTRVRPDKTPELLFRNISPRGQMISNLLRPVEMVRGLVWTGFPFWVIQPYGGKSFELVLTMPAGKRRKRTVARFAVPASVFRTAQRWHRR